MPRLPASPRFLLTAMAVLSLLAQTACTVAPPATPAVEATQARADSGTVLVSDARIQQLRAAVAAGIEPTYSAWLQVKELADANLDRQPTVLKEWYVPGYYVDAEGHQRAKNGLRDDANTAYALALTYRMTGERSYADAAVRLIDGWIGEIESMSTKDDSTLSFSYHFPAFIYAADLLRDEGVWPAENQQVFEAFLRDKALPMSPIKAQNNWGNWGLVLSSSIAAYLHDEELLERCAQRWKEFIESQIAEDGHLPHEVTRSKGRHGIWYSHFSLMPQTLAAEILRQQGYELYDYVSPSGRTLQSAFERLVPWVEHPETFHYWEGDPADLASPRYFSYFEILNAHWPNAGATRLLEADRPMNASHSAPFLTFTHGQ